MKTSQLIFCAVLWTLLGSCKGSTPADPDPIDFSLNGHVIFVSEGGGAPFTDGLWAIDLSEMTGALRLVSASASDPHALVDEGIVVYTKWSPAQSQDIYLGSVVGGFEHNLTGRPQVSEFYPDISPDASLVVFAALYPSTGATALCRIDSGGMGLRAITDTTSAASQSWLPRWSPTASLIAYLHRTQSPPAAQYSLATIAPDGSGQKDLVRSHNLYAPQWSPDGKLIAYASVSGTTLGIGLYELESGTSKELTLSGKTPDPNGFAWTPTGEFYFFGRGSLDSLYDLFRLSTPMVGAPVQIAAGFRYPASIIVSSDAVTIGVLGNSAAGSVELVVMRRDGSQRTSIIQLTSGVSIQMGGFVQWVGQ